jgi:hypothetical protein
VSHSNLVHPSTANPTLDACVLCQLVAMADPQYWINRAREQGGQVDVLLSARGPSGTGNVDVWSPDQVGEKP